MGLTSRACALVCLAAGVGVSGPAAAAMTIVFRGSWGQTMTYQHEGGRVRVTNPRGDDDTEVTIVDLNTGENILVYDDAKVYFDFKKASEARAAVRAKAQPARKRPAAAARYRTLAKTRTVNGFSCDVYERVVARRVDAELCFALWGGAVGEQKDFAWFDAFLDRVELDVMGKSRPPPVSRSSDRDPGLAISTTSIAEDGSREVLEVVNISRDPLPAAMFHVPADYTEMPLGAGERPHRPPHQVNAAPVQTAAPPPPGHRISGLVAILLVAGVFIGLGIHAAILHLAANVVLEAPRFIEALVAAAIIWAVLVVAWLLRLPPVLGSAVGLLATFAGLKISYGASIARTLALFVVCGMIAALASFAGGVFLS